MELFIIILLVLGFGWLVYQNKFQSNEANDSKNDELIQQVIELKSELSAKDERIKILNEQLKESQNSKEETEKRLAKEFENLGSSNLHIVDLDRTLDSDTSNLSSIKEIRKHTSALLLP